MSPTIAEHMQEFCRIFGWQRTDILRHVVDYEQEFFHVGEEVVSAHGLTYCVRTALQGIYQFRSPCTTSESLRLRTKEDLMSFQSPPAMKASVDLALKNGLPVKECKLNSLSIHSSY